MTEDQAHTVARRLIEFLETGEVPQGLFTPDAFCDFTMPLWRLQAQGVDSVVALRLHGHPGPSSIPRWRCDATASGFILEVEERWVWDGKDWYCREMTSVDVLGESISKYFGVPHWRLGLWPSATIQLLRP